MGAIRGKQPWISYNRGYERTIHGWLSSENLHTVSKSHMHHENILCFSFGHSGGELSMIKKWINSGKIASVEISTASKSYENLRGDGYSIAEHVSEARNENNNFCATLRS